jgi:hypothetical protein
MSLTEEEAAKIILIRSVEECDPRAFSEELRTHAFVAAKQAQPGLDSVKRYAAYLFERLSPAYQSIPHLVNVPTPWTVPICGTALILGFGTNLLGPAETLHVVRNPVFIVVAWNLLVYIALLAVLIAGVGNLRSSLHEGRAPAAPNPSHSRSVLRYLLPGIWQFFHRMVFGFHEQKNLAQVTRRFSYHWFSAAGALVVARWRRLLHLAALSLAAGAVAGMYFRGLFQGYRVIWASTFITDLQSVSTFIAVVFGPSLWLSKFLGLGLESEISVARLLTVAGDDADAWIHLFAITVAIAIFIPRFLLAYWQSRKINRMSNGIALPLDNYYGEVIEGPVRSMIEREVETEVKKLSAEIAKFVASSLYRERIVPKLRSFREQGGKIADLKRDLTATTEAFLPQLQSYIAVAAIPELQKSLSQRIGELLKSIGTSFVDIKDPQGVLDGLRMTSTDPSEINITHEFSRAVGLSVGTSIALAVATVGGGLGQELGLAIIATVLGTTGPIGFVIGLIAGTMLAAGAWWWGREKITEAVESATLPGAVVRTALWPSRFERLIDEGRQKCENTVRAEVDEKLLAMAPKITTEILIRVRLLWQG